MFRLKFFNYNVDTKFEQLISSNLMFDIERVPPRTRNHRSNVLSFSSSSTNSN